MSSTRIAFIGLGNMGRPMALNLARAGHGVAGFDVSEGALGAARAEGVPLAASLGEAVRDAEVVMTMLPAGAHVLSIWQEALPHLAPGTLLVDCSTIDIESAGRAHELAAEAGFASLDAPVSGGTKGAAGGTLTFMTGGDEAAFTRARPLLEAMGSKIVHCGGAGAGQAAKICNNMILGVSMIAVAEAFVLAEKLGLSAQALFDVASTSSGQCWSLTTYCPVPGPVPTSPANNDYRPGFAAGLMLKDLRLAKAAAEAGGVATPLGHHAEAIYAAFAEAGQGDVDFSGIIRHLRDAGS
ncbi:MULTISPECIES: 3-hydroxyisobutyrate dehydrogenase [unclassified Aureimonas]|uniref:3-hydroxyisobutyrate dehydrogenase n=1 Tax=unclassified Aureimonas TaxID=2615206 RepID=UPI0006FB1B1A|nr:MULTISPECIES: 3-hydroxyisobutyrate dehydrogenase [unclassified Aureimonas]KQT69841.1 3-hydroxyisobutyrate dehydrogenase [Aureimonas sp. Leaf427]KQT76007.1 3-hydroxyisobutyrate dehydrogenase [Aureimonas sp. Leaf460]